MEHRQRNSPGRVSLDDFELRYRDRADPWDFRSSPYEQRRYDLTAAALLRERYRRCFEPACSIGELTLRLVTRCDEVVALEPAATALDVARTRLAGVANVELRRGAVPEDWPSGSFDLVVLSEIGYYFEPAGIRLLAQLTKDSLSRDGEVVAVHWRGHSRDHLMGGDEVHALLRDEFGDPVVRYEQAEFRLDGWGQR